MIKNIQWKALNKIADAYLKHLNVELSDKQKKMLVSSPGFVDMVRANMEELFRDGQLSKELPVLKWKSSAGRKRANRAPRKPTVPMITKE
jgi:hypothetical protein